MKKMRKIIPALAMLLVSAVMMSTASFAWFSINTTVDATGMQMKATSSGGLAIAVKDTFMANVGDAPLASAYASSVNFGTGAWSNNAASISPATHFATDNKWFTASSNSPTSHAASGAYSPVAITGTGTETNTHFYKTQCVVKTLSEGNADLYLDKIIVKGQDTSSELDLSIRVAFEVAGTWYYFAPKRTAAPDTIGYVCYNGTSTAANGYVPASATSVTEGTGVNAGTYTCEFTNVKLGALDGVADGQTPTLVNIYVYFDGEDPACKSANVQSLVTLDIGFIFSTTNG